MRRILPGLALALLASGSAAGAGPDEVFAPLQPPEISEEDGSRLADGDVLVLDLPTPDGEGVGVMAMGLVDAPPAQVWSVMADCEHQDEFLPRIAHASVRDREGDSHTCDLVVHLPFPLEDRRSATRNHARRLPDGGYQRYWDLVPGDWSYLRNHGSWTVHPYQGGSLLINRMDLLPKSSFPLWLVRTAQRRLAPASFEAIRARVRALQARERDDPD